MTDLDARVRRALDAQHVPDSLRQKTLAAIEEARARQGAEGASAAPGQPLAADVPATSVGPTAAAEAAAPSPAVRAAARRRRPARAITALAACLVLALAGFGLHSVYREPVAFVGIDVNPSIELGINRFDRVVEARPLNDDGRILLEDVALTGLGYQEAIDALTTSAAFAPYADAGSLVEVSVASADTALADRLAAQTDAALEALPCDHACGSVGTEVRDQASAAGMGMARYQAAQELVALDPSLTLDECAAMSMRELRDRISACAGHGESSSGDAPAGAGRGPHAGSGAGEGRGAQGQGQGEGTGGSHGHGRHGA
ncbi:hypothetical protein [Enterorhabdus sp. P55]|uniref:anti-sigma-I factor RsgI family protein n=1 Tax=Enterorhabdus sp. P55 TaxID=2304571 RepID=UPI00136E8DC6|nr:hypothetical protein [Enterorhabdus sp. P55]NBI32503.1 hypothetical protein [Enterorhabdus sp. P55]